MSELSRFVMNGLNNAKRQISATLEDKTPLSVAPIDSSLLALVSLLQEYAQFLGQRGDQGICKKEYIYIYIYMCVCVCD